MAACLARRGIAGLQGNSPYMETVTPRSKRRHTEVLEHLLGRIVSGELRPGTILPTEPEFAHQLGVSRAVLREALSALAAKGLVESRRGSGTRVAPAESWNQFDAAILDARRRSGAMESVLADLIEARLIVECEVAALAALRLTEAHRRSLDFELAKMRDNLERPAVYAAADAEFHRTLLLAADNAVLLRMVEPIRTLIAYAQSLTDTTRPEQRRALGEHEAIADAIARRDSDTARRIMKLHLINTEDDLRRILKAR